MPIQPGTLPGYTLEAHHSVPTHSGIYQNPIIYIGSFSSIASFGHSSLQASQAIHSSVIFKAITLLPLFLLYLVVVL